MTPVRNALRKRSQFMSIFSTLWRLNSLSGRERPVRNTQYGMVW